METLNLLFQIAGEASLNMGYRQALLVSHELFNLNFMRFKSFWKNNGLFSLTGDSSHTVHVLSRNPLLFKAHGETELLLFLKSIMSGQIQCGGI